MRQQAWILVLLAIFWLTACDQTTPPSPNDQAQTTTSSGNTKTSQDIKDQCTSCHGKDGASGQADAPFIAGQQLQYLATALHAYTDNSRNNAAMATAMSGLDEAQINDVATHYSAMTSEWHGVEKPSITQQTSTDLKLINAGKITAMPCSSCHSLDGASHNAAIPSLAGLNQAYLAKALDEYFNGKRHSSVMGIFRTSFTPQKIKEVTAYFSSLPPQQSPLAATGDMIAGKTEAISCGGCHGVDGNSPYPGIPSLAGQNPHYLVNALRAYRDRHRDDAMMRSAIQGLSEEQFKNISAYFAAQKPHPFTINEQDPLKAGAALAGSCNACHAKPGAKTPRLSGLDQTYLDRSIMQYQLGARKHELMSLLVSQLSVTDIEKISGYYAGQKPLPRAGKETGDIASAQQLTSSCTDCHGADGNSTQPLIPSLAGQNPEYIATALHAYASNDRDNSDMQKAAATLGDNDISVVANFFAAQTPQPSQPRSPQSPEVLAQKCDRCHGENGYSHEVDKPRLAGQRQSYLEKTLHEYKQGSRKNSAMHAMSDVLSATEIKGIAAYYSAK
ncbi:MAG: c-type cytochrome [Gammaproteobacteria bacterium]|nr:c-type cytochrome [Gammaproteobacteria bacterium]